MASLYLHIPFCKQRCIYCDFYFVTTHRSTSPFVQALLKEITIQGQGYGMREPIDTIYFGGGTPSQLSVEDIHTILQEIDTYFDTTRVSEVSFEINPDDVDTAYLRALRQTGINRLSIGVQSFSDRDLVWMNRAHSQEQASEVIEQARQAGFDNFSIDLIFGLPEQSIDTWHQTLNIVRDLKPPHISTYSLTVEPGTVLNKRISNRLEAPPNEEDLAAFYLAAMDTLPLMGYEHYEVSSFARPGFRSQHNQAYWTHNNYLGFGPSAHSFWKEDHLKAHRWKNINNLRGYINQLESGNLASSDVESILHTELLDEYIMLRLRMVDGLDLHYIKDAFDVDLMRTKKETIDRLLHTGHLAMAHASRIHLTPKGFLVCDSIIGDLLV